jgi:hypothetical protein
MSCFIISLPVFAAAQSIWGKIASIPEGAFVNCLFACIAEIYYPLQASLSIGDSSLIFVAR